MRRMKQFDQDTLKQDRPISNQAPQPLEKKHPFKLVRLEERIAPGGAHHTGPRDASIFMGKR